MPLQDWDHYLFESIRRDMLEEFTLLVQSICKTLNCEPKTVLNIRNVNCKKTPKGATPLMLSCMVCNSLKIPTYIEKNGGNVQARDDDNKDIMDYIYKNKKKQNELEEYFGAKFLMTNEKLEKVTDRPSYLKL